MCVIYNINFFFINDDPVIHEPDQVFTLEHSFLK